ncbi:MBL fold metallo-hydrolase [Paenibacillus motobuensis]|uniref:Pyrroloquinoline quinone biosynthesis protein PqqB n=1 Tax=Paenibacillus motobuensis TaxID=295324 RepID=A0ABN0YPX1_9BACL
MNEVIVNIIGTAQDAGVPHPNCFCQNCMSAMQNGTRRFAASLAIIEPNRKQWHLVDATPDMREQMAKIQMKYHLQGQIMNSIWLTHAHIGHYPGLMFLGREAMGAQGVPVFCGDHMKQMLEANAPWSQLVELNNIQLNGIQHERQEQLSPSVRITPIEVPHRNELSETFGFWIEGPQRKLLYIPDIDRWDEWDRDIFDMAEEADICLLDGTFHSIEEIEQMGRNYKEIPHPVMTETMDRLQGLAEHTEIYFTHFNHTNPVNDQASTFAQLVQDRAFYIAEDGMELKL